VCDVIAGDLAPITTGDTTSLIIGQLVIGDPNRFTFGDFTLFALRFLALLVDFTLFTSGSFCELSIESFYALMEI
jgi:hypothetical protein